MKLGQFWPRPHAAALVFCLTAVGIAEAGSGTTTGDVAQRYLVRFDETPLARYNSVAQATQGSQAHLIPIVRSAGGRARLDLGSAEAVSYVDYVRGRQDQHLVDIAAVIGRNPETVQSMQHALSAAIVMLTPLEASKLGAIAGVLAVEPDHQVPLTSDVGPTFTGAASVWWGTRAGEDSLFAPSFDNVTRYRGDGVVIGDIDTGYNSASPSFQASGLDGANIVNPLGSGHYLGQCGVAGISIAGCNNKVIGVYDEIGLIAGANHAPYTVEDQMGHGSHTASIAAGDLRMASLSGYTTTIAGVAPHANLVVYRVCSPALGCSYSAIVAAIDQAIADNIVDALNFSIGVVGNPWYDSVALAFLSAVDAGIFVAAAGGNVTPTTSQVSQTVINYEPWVTTVASSFHSGGALVQGATSTYRAAAAGDMLSPTSLLGPAPTDVIKPDMQAPGVDIIAAIANDGSAGGPALVGMKEGTSMSTAHMTGAGALLLGLHRDWAPLEVKSALMMTAKESGLTKADGTTPSDFFDRGSGRLQEFVARNSGLVMNETGTRLSGANTATGGDPSTLNFATMQKASCSSACTFSRTFRSTQDHAVTWTIGVVPGPVSGFSSVTATPATFTVGAKAMSPAIALRANTSALPADNSFHFADVVLTPNDSKLVPLHLPLAVAVP